MEPILYAQHVHRVFGSGAGAVHAINDISMQILPGRLTILRGRSGSGKTCMINLLGALDLPTQGQIGYENQLLSGKSERWRDHLRKTAYGFIFQSVALMPTMSAYENVDFALRLAGTPANQRDERVRACLKLVGLEKRMQHRPAELSGGEQQRVAIARAISHRPKVLFADEPTAELDSHMGLVVVKLLKDLIRHEGVTVVMTTHDPNMFELADDVYTLENGTVTQQAHITPLFEPQGVVLG